MVELRNHCLLGADPFSDMSFSSLRRLYRISKERKKEMDSNEKNGENF